MVVEAAVGAATGEVVVVVAAGMAAVLEEAVDTWVVDSAVAACT
jgi:hypothetical protein